MTGTPYDAYDTPRTPGELVLARLILVATGAIAILVIVLYSLLSPVTAQWIGSMIGLNVPNVAAGVVALLMRPGRRWVRWTIVVLSAIRCLTITTYYVIPGGFTYSSFLLLPVAVLVAVNLPAARAYFTGG